MHDLGFRVACIGAHLKEQKFLRSMSSVLGGHRSRICDVYVIASTPAGSNKSVQGLLEGTLDVRFEGLGFIGLGFGIVQTRWLHITRP